MGDTSAPAPARLRYVVLRHEGVADSHFDLMFETSPGSPLATWRSPRWPIDQPTQLARLADHRAIYLDDEGPLAGARGHVKRIAAGECDLTTASARWVIQFDQPLGSRLIMEQLHDEQWKARPEQNAAAEESPSR